MDSSHNSSDAEMEYSRDNAGNNDNPYNNNNNNRSSNRVLIHGLISGSVPIDQEGDKQDKYTDEDCRELEELTINSNSTRQTEHCKSYQSPPSRPNSSDRKCKPSDIRVDADVEATDLSHHHHTNGLCNSNIDNINHISSVISSSSSSSVDVSFSEMDNLNDCGHDEAVDISVDKDIEGFHKKIKKSSADNVVNVESITHNNADLFGSSVMKTGSQNDKIIGEQHKFSSAEVREMSPEKGHLLLPFSSNSASIPSSSVSKLARDPDIVITSKSVHGSSLYLDEECGSAKASTKRDSRKSSYPSGQGQTELLGRKSSLNGPSAVTRSLPIHCVIEQSPVEAEDLSWRSEEFQIVNDTYAILPGNTLFSNIVASSLSRLGYSDDEATGATGGIQLKNWLTLDFQVITDNEDATVEEMLGEIISVATLQIRLASKINDHSQEDIKQKLVQLLFKHSQDFLLATGCPIDKAILGAVAQGNLSQKIPDPVCNAFIAWYNQKIKKKSSYPETESCREFSFKPSSEEHQKSIATTLSTSEIVDFPDSDKPAMSSQAQTASLSKSMSPLKSSLFCTSTPSIKGTKKHEATPISNMQYLNQPIKSEHINTKQDMCMSSQCHHENQQKHCHFSQHLSKCELPSSVNQKILSEHPSDRLEKTSLSACDANLAMNFPSHASNPYLGIMPGKTRIRTSFDPEHEIPRLQKWFSDNQHPTREQMMRFMQELNTLESRKGRRPLDLTNIIYWFKNARAAQRRATKAMDDSFENEENLDVSNASSGGTATGETVPPYLPNKNAVYMIPFHPYPQILSRSGNAGSSENVMSTIGSGVGNGCDEPYDLSVSKRTSSESGKSSMSNEIGSSESCGNYYNSSPIPKMSPESPEDPSSDRDTIKKKSTGQCPPPRFPALLDVVSKMRREIPPTSEDVYNNNSNNTNNINSNVMSNKNHRESPFRPNSRSSDVDNVYKSEDLEQSYSDQSIHHRDNGFIMSPHHMQTMKMKCDERIYNSDPVISNKKKHYDFEHGSDIELGQIKKEETPTPQNNGNINCSDEDNSNDSYDSEEELKIRMKQNVAAVADYASAMHNNVSRLTAANMAALSLAQMGQPLHIPQLAPSLAMAYYPMDPRFYSQPSVSSSLPSSTSPTPTSSHLTPHQGQTTPNSLLDSSSPLPSPSSMQHSIGQHNHHHHHHHHHQRQQHQQQQNSHQHSEPRKRRTRVFIDPLSEIPKLEKWFKEDTHPSAFMIDKFCEELNKCEYRQKFPKLEPKNVQLWFKNHRAKVKRLKVSFNCKYEGDDEFLGETEVDGDGDMKGESFELQ